MTLTNRVSAFFLGWLGLSLVGFAVAVFLVVRADLYQQADNRLAGTLDTLAAAAEINPRGIEWEPHERALARPAGGTIWLIVEPGGTVVDRSADPADWLLLEAARPAHRRKVVTLTDPGGAHWRVARQRLETPAGPVELEVTPAGEMRYPALDIVAGSPEAPIRRKLIRLTGWLLTLTVGLWLIAVLIGRWLCRRTLAPVAEMAAAARTLSPADPGERLSVRPTGDELEDLGRAFNGALARLEEAFDRQARFTGDASHQLRTPLAAMLGQVEVALRRDRDAADYRTTLRSVADEIRHLHRLTEALLFLARADAEAGLPDLAEVNLAEWATGHVGDWRAAHPTAAIELTVDGSPGPVRAHSELLAQLLDNLIDNSVKYGPPGGPVHVRLRRQNGEVELTVEDAGAGIAAEDLPHLFDPFFRSAAARAAGVRGVGLGLSVARRIAEAMGARLTADSGPGRGSRFSVRFPAQETA